jgi:hypothetical protein
MAAARAISKINFRRIILSLILFGIAFGYVEGSVVVYLRALGEPIRAAAGLPNGDLFPLLKISQLGAHLAIVKTEVIREGATIVMLAAVAAAATRTFPGWLAAFSIVFGAWDLSFYATLKALLGWPASLMTWDLLFLIPVPWVGPVLAPSLVSVTLIAGGIVGLVREPKRVDRITWTLLVAGGVVIFAAFIWDWRYIEAGGYPRAFPWTIFFAGELAGIAGVARAQWQNRVPSGEKLRHYVSSNVG